MAFAVDGLASGLDTTALINSLMQIEAVPQTLLKRQVASTQTTLSALQNLNSRVAALGERAKELLKPQALAPAAASSSSDAVTATARPGTAAGSIDIIVDQLASRQSSVSAAMSEWTAGPLTISTAAGSVVVDPASGALDDLVAAINASGAGVSATKVSVGGGLARLQLTSATSGTEGAFTVSAGGFTDVVPARDAQVRLWAGTGAEQVITSSSNTFTDLLPGVDVTVRETSTDAVTIDVARDDATITESVTEFAGMIGQLVQYIATNSAVTVSNGAGGSTTKGGIFTGDSMVRDVRSRLTDAAIGPVDGRSPSEIGITITRQGAIEFDEEKFTAALADDAAFAQRAITVIAERIASASDLVSDKYDGILTQKITGQESTVKRLSDQVLEWDARLEQRRTTLQRTYAALEVAMGQLNAQSSWLSSQLAGLSTGQGSKR
ncbi:flagellar filament capping protein FliD [Ruicaihuangia caeni]|uniref:Flagellar hook-associated protein 2 n=1 Tax=Ruicaihuangia caeni TaxID=3042517 RepID=A0AAW6T898_9MICO|nr:flagellar filament capping protein FliD [Klugiella sp. YN-L-19]MDI2097872.1 flagellar filament capping protein FliD [Klugiella sp. YN-L-19]